MRNREILAWAKAALDNTDSLQGASRPKILPLVAVRLARGVLNKNERSLYFGVVTRQGRLEERITDAAERLFAQDGFAATGMRAIAQAAKVSIGAIYHHFHGKEEILESIIREEVKRRQRLLEGLRKQGLPLQEQVQQIVQMHFTLLQGKDDAARLFFRERFDPSPVSKGRIQTLYDEVAEHVAEIIQEGITRGEVRPCHPLLTAYAVLGMVEAVSLRALGRDETAALFMKEGPKELAESIWLWLRLRQEGDPA